MKILLVSGHKPGYNASALTGVNEGDLNVELVKLLKPRLSKYADVETYPYDRDMYEDNKAGNLRVNLKNYNYVFEVHFNGFNNVAHGTGIYLDQKYKGGISVEQAVLRNIVALGFTNRGITRRNDLLNMRTCFNLNVDYALLETCFFDNVEDMALYKQKKTQVADAITKGIADAFGLTAKEEAPKAEAPKEEAPKAETPKEETETIYRVQVGAYSVKANAETMLAKLEKAGFSGFIVASR